MRCVVVDLLDTLLVNWSSQIIRRALYNCPWGASANGAFNVVEWNEDPFNEIHYNDALWAYTIRAFEEWRNHNVDQWTDPIVNRLMLMGFPDWVDPDCCQLARIQAMQFVMVFGLHLQQRII